MNLPRIIAQLARAPASISALIAPLNAEEYRFKPPTGAWSILEIINHLADEDRDDFRFRLKSTLENPATPWPPTNPEAWAVERNYQDRDLAESLARFVYERDESLRWLRSLNNPDWSVAYIHQRHGPVHAGELLASWPAHDALHIRQIAKRLFELAQREGAAAGFGIGYAGQWGA